MFLVKYDADGNKLWTQQKGTGANEYTYGVVVSSPGDIYVIGITEGAFSGYTNQGSLLL